MKKLNRLSIVGYGAGDAANNLAFTTATMFLLVYYTDVAGISAAAAGTLLLAVRIFDAFADVFAGRIVDRTFSKRFGKFRPFIMFGSIPLLLLSVATFSVPQIGETGTLLYAYVTYAALGLAYSLVNIPYGSLAGAMTQDPGERAKLGSARMIGAALVGSSLGIFVAPLIKPGANLQATFTGITLAFVVIGAALYFFTVFTAKERVHRSVPNVSFKQSVDTLKGNKPLMMLCLSSFLFLTGYLALTSVQLYYLRDVLGRLDLYPVLSIAQLVLTFVLAAIMPRLVRTIGKKNVYIYASLVSVVGGIIIFAAPPSQTWIGFGGLIVSLVGVMAVNIVVWALEADTVEYGEWKTGVRTEGITYALFSFTRKTGQAVGGALAAYALALGGYKSGAVQTAEAAFGIQVAAGAIPAVLTILAVLVMSRYKLTDDMHAGIIRDITARRAEAEAGPDAASAPQAAASTTSASAAHTS
ncbi:sugar (Glycoside-Pentoside-Hexuronide) transporter [Pseudarthrobacter chlorophenolicus A6]|uniref:Sugar (Glycoside-Pentoside-Hexuronide) transporter n=1 Tax=Pseudarthrobacter chlorophenolicus (strain ATCC 700700 / DSM 12829 / CIP 107037 / JCM 12360 / KCTC 9906 / NCIMB 13794 / A6) TaxID=452863 RepID=B8HCK1_PSECP|nr:glucuronide transporter [Pseudarthrobacter chlorophenolicus]ACL38784.1 sugar (Glycoside-Pentoside-Hexuronide) transporter [Pseudarthrobacter chlorophenolicus A6]SDR08797.1 glucuronide carrier protein [Pseudarthrobacter chlorophenolicus]